MKPMFNSTHRRYNPLTGEWILVSPQRANRPWQGQVEQTASPPLPDYDPTCYLCPGNKRAGGITNPAYTDTFVFDNDYPALLPQIESQKLIIEDQTQPSNPSPSEIESEHSMLFKAKPESGICRVICFHPRHNLTLPQLPLNEVENIVNTWTEQTAELFSHPEIAHVQIFENKGEVMGCSNPHPHSQIWSQSRIPTEPAKELASQKDYFAEHGSPLLLDYLAGEQQSLERIIVSNEHFTALVPFWAVWPFEILVIAHCAVPCLPDLTRTERRALADIYRRITIRYDNLFETSFPYSMGFHQAPNDKTDHPECVLHAHFYPPLLRSAFIRKFMVGYEMLGMPQRDITPETAAALLRGRPEIHYSQK
jgi:UDPglucose--hexose-1-phosphate uridylyltransferase